MKIFYVTETNQAENSLILTEESLMSYGVMTTISIVKSTVDFHLSDLLLSAVSCFYYMLVSFTSWR